MVQLCDMTPDLTALRAQLDDVTGRMSSGHAGPAEHAVLLDCLALAALACGTCSQQQQLQRVHRPFLRRFLEVAEKTPLVQVRVVEGGGEDGVGCGVCGCLQGLCMDTFRVFKGGFRVMDAFRVYRCILGFRMHL